MQLPDLNGVGVRCGDVNATLRQVDIDADGEYFITDEKRVVLGVAAANVDPEQSKTGKGQEQVKVSPYCAGNT